MSNVSIIISNLTFIISIGLMIWSSILLFTITKKEFTNSAGTSIVGSSSRTSQQKLDATILSEDNTDNAIDQLGYSTICLGNVPVTGTLAHSGYDIPGSPQMPVAGSFPPCNKWETTNST